MDEQHAFIDCTDESKHLFAIDHPHCAVPGCGRVPEDPIHSVDVAERAA